MSVDGCHVLFPICDHGFQTYLCAVNLPCHLVTLSPCHLVTVLVCVLYLHRANLTAVQGGAQNVGTEGNVVSQGRLQQSLQGGEMPYIHTYIHTYVRTNSAVQVVCVARVRDVGVIPPTHGR